MLQLRRRLSLPLPVSISSLETMSSSSSSSSSSASSSSKSRRKTHLEVKPELLTFHLVPHTECKTFLILKNVTDAYVAFKVKTTSPDRYLVRPNQALIDIGTHAKVEITITPKRVDEILQADDGACQGQGNAATGASRRMTIKELIGDDKFLVQSMKTGEDIMEQAKKSNKKPEQFALYLSKIFSRAMERKKRR